MSAKGASVGKKKSGGFLARKAKANKIVTEDELLTKDSITPDEVLGIKGITESKYIDRCL